MGLAGAFKRKYTVLKNWTAQLVIYLLILIALELFYTMIPMVLHVLFAVYAKATFSCLKITFFELQLVYVTGKDSIGYHKIEEE